MAKKAIKKKTVKKAVKKTAKKSAPKKLTAKKPTAKKAVSKTQLANQAAKIIQQLKKRHSKIIMHPMLPIGHGGGNGGGNGGGSQTYTLHINNADAVWVHSGALPSKLIGTASNNGTLTADVEINAANSSGTVLSELVYILQPTTSFTALLTAQLQSISHTIIGANSSVVVGIDVYNLPHNGGNGQTLVNSATSIGNNQQTLTAQFGVNTSNSYAIIIYCMAVASVNGGIAKASFNVPSVTYTQH